MPEDFAAGSVECFWTSSGATLAHNTNLKRPARKLAPLHHPHPAAANPGQDAVMGNRFTHGLGGRGHWVDMLGRGKVRVNERRGVGYRKKRCGCARWIRFKWHLHGA